MSTVTLKIHKINSQKTKQMKMRKASKWIRCKKEKPSSQKLILKNNK